MARTSFIFLLLLLAPFFELATATNICTWGFYMCASNFQCIHSSNRCDGTYHCTNGEDERNCSRCSGYYFRCSNNNCVSKFGLCDGVDNCGDGSDESTYLCGGTVFPMRLVGGRWPNEGRVEVYYSPTASWGTICNYDWGLRDANVVCRQLGLPPAAQINFQDGFGRGTGPILLNNLRCTGSELTLSKCRTDAWKYHECRHRRDDVGVVCGTQVPTGTSPIRCHYCRSTTSDDQCSTVTCPDKRFCYRRTADRYYRGSTSRVTIAGCTESCTSYETTSICRLEMNCKLSCCRTSLCNSDPRPQSRLQCHNCSSSSCSCTTTMCPLNPRRGYCYRKIYYRIIGGSSTRVSIAGCTQSCTSSDRTAACRYESNCKMTCCTTPLCNLDYSGSSYPSCYTCSSNSSYEDCENKAKLTPCHSASASCYKINYVKLSSSYAEISVYEKGCTIGSTSCSQVESTHCNSKDKCRVYCCTRSGCNAGSILRFSVVVLVTCAVGFLILG